jgi:C4-dicarboxylate-specific signal transduction histidine kinase
MLHDRHGRRKSQAIEALRQAQRSLAADTTLAALGRLSSAG